MTADDIVKALRENVPATLMNGGIFLNDKAVLWLLTGGREYSDGHFRRLRREGKLPPGIRVAGKWRYDPRDVAEWFNAQKRARTDMGRTSADISNASDLARDAAAVDRNDVTKETT